MLHQLAEHLCILLKRISRDREYSLTMNDDMVPAIVMSYTTDGIFIIKQVSNPAQYLEFSRSLLLKFLFTMNSCIPHVALPCPFQLMILAKVFNDCIKKELDLLPTRRSLSISDPPLKMISDKPFWRNHVDEYFAGEAVDFELESMMRVQVDAFRTQNIDLLDCNYAFFRICHILRENANNG